MLELYHHNISVCAQKVRLALHEKGIDWEGHHIDLMKGEQTSPEYLAINPRGVTPTLVHDGNPVIESTIILEYLEDAFPELPLRPASALSRARMRVWVYNRQFQSGLPQCCVHGSSQNGDGTNLWDGTVANRTCRGVIRRTRLTANN